MSCPITCSSRWATRVLGDGIEARRFSFEGRSGGGAGSGTGWGVISARALLAQKAQMRVVESRTPPSKSGTLELKQKSQERGWSDMETPKAEAYQDHPRWVVERPPRWCQLLPEWAGSAVRSCGGLGNLARVIGSIHLHNVRIRVGDGGIK